jgi:hypothetical protein
MKVKVTLADNFSGVAAAMQPQKGAIGLNEATLPILYKKGGVGQGVE